MQNIKPAASYHGELIGTPSPKPSSQAGETRCDDDAGTKHNAPENPAYVYTKGIYSDDLEKTRDNTQLERYQKMLENIRSQSKKLTPKKPKVNFNAVTELIQLANSETVSQASAVLSRVRV